MKIQFDSELDCQRDAINSVVKLFEGQETRKATLQFQLLILTVNKTWFRVNKRVNKKSP